MPTKSQRLRVKLVKQLREHSFLSSDDIAEAFLAVPRELFVPEAAARDGVEAVYEDKAIVTRKDAIGIATSSSSQPAIMAQMLQMLGPQPGHRILEIGTGTGYNAALLKTIVGPKGRVLTIDVDSGCTRTARATLREANLPVRAITADARTDPLPGTPFHRMIVTASTETIPRTWFDALQDDGILVLPLRITDSCFQPQLVIALRKHEGRLAFLSSAMGGFMGMRRPEDGGMMFPAINATAYINGEQTQHFLEGTALQLLTAASRRRLLSILLDRRRETLFESDSPAGNGVLLFAALSTPRRRHISSYGWWTTGILAPDGGGFALLSRVNGHFKIQAVGHSGPEKQLQDIVTRWRNQGSPAWDHLRIEAHYSRTRAWRTSTRGESVLAFDWLP